ncbi:RagB/SusD family nutrient uptake outer membrane protein [Flagellimonas pacifica]|uniref:Starch-binding associating with outer membrane n=1 Tax=Flagellimonas pacifica TaxID=1247520 RepID=A0A285MX28_9FLAO|nr:RagB/SusD family nutrient uptake outer membrane protein [Allomuricauda parva]SNZ01750.1 Starch-binding associating with outer membrane [Allomuricauda parva]
MKTIKIKIIPVLAILSMIVVACNDDFLEKINPNEITTDTFYQTEEDAILAVNSVYAVLQHYDLFKQGYWFIYNGMTDDVGWAGWDGELSNVMFNFSHSPILARSNSIWDALYKGIFRANLVINNVEKMEDFDLKQRILGEAHFLRGWYYLELADSWGGVPIILDEIQVSNEYNFPKSTRQQVYDQVEADFKFAETNLPLKSAYGGSDVGRATSGAASAYLGRSYLYQKKWGEAIMQFEKVIASGEYQLTDNYADNFSAATENNSESLFEVQFSGDGTALWSDDATESAEHNFIPVQYFRWAETGPMFNFLRNALFGPPWAGRGPRRAATFGSRWDDGNYNRIIKFVEFNTNDFRKSDVNLRDMRYSDVLLMYAEALNENGQTPEAITQVDIVIDRVRQESGLANPSDWTDITELKTVEQLTQGDHSGWPLYLTGTDQEGIRNVIKHQRRIEFMYEFKRLKDLIRWGDAEDALVREDDEGNEIQLFQVGKHELFPIPDVEISGNAGLTPADQNPGY